MDRVVEIHWSDILRNVKGWDKREKREDKEYRNSGKRGEID